MHSVIKSEKHSVVIDKTKVVEFLLRTGIAATFFGHGMLAIAKNAAWIPLITAFGFSEEAAKTLLPLIGIMDVAVAFIALLYPMRAVLIWAVIWPILTALSRPLSGAPVMEFVERAANWIVPLVLLLLKGFPTKAKDLWT